MEYRKSMENTKKGTWWSRHHRTAASTWDPWLDILLSQQSWCIGWSMACLMNILSTCAISNVIFSPILWHNQALVNCFAKGKNKRSITPGRRYVFGRPNVISSRIWQTLYSVLLQPKDSPHEWWDVSCLQEWFLTILWEFSK